MRHQMTEEHKARMQEGRAIAAERKRAEGLPARVNRDKPTTHVPGPSTDLIFRLQRELNRERDKRDGVVLQLEGLDRLIAQLETALQALSPPPKPDFLWADTQVSLDPKDAPVVAPPKNKGSLPNRGTYAARKDREKAIRALFESGATLTAEMVHETLRRRGDTLSYDFLNHYLRRLSTGKKPFLKRVRRTKAGYHYTLVPKPEEPKPDLFDPRVAAVAGAPEDVRLKPLTAAEQLGISRLDIR